jgi:hypothetical protein
MCKKLNCSNPVDMRKYIYPVYINKDGNPSTKSTRHVEANANTQKENQNNQNNSNKVEDLMLKEHPLSQMS